MLPASPPPPLLPPLKLAPGPQSNETIPLAAPDPMLTPISKLLQFSTSPRCTAVMCDGLLCVRQHLAAPPAPAQVGSDGTNMIVPMGEHRCMAAMACMHPGPAVHYIITARCVSRRGHAGLSQYGALQHEPMHPATEPCPAVPPRLTQAWFSAALPWLAWCSCSGCSTDAWTALRARMLGRLQTRVGAGRSVSHAAQVERAPAWDAVASPAVSHLQGCCRQLSATCRLPVGSLSPTCSAAALLETLAICRHGVRHGIPPCRACTRSPACPCSCRGPPQCASCPSAEPGVGEPHLPKLPVIIVLPDNKTLSLGWQLEHTACASPTASSAAEGSCASGRVALEGSKQAADGSSGPCPRAAFASSTLALGAGTGSEMYVAPAPTASAGLTPAGGSRKLTDGSRRECPPRPPCPWLPPLHLRDHRTAATDP